MSNEDKGPFSGPGPKGYKRPPESLESQVADALQADGYIDASEIRVKVQAETGELTLSGTVPTREQTERAERRAAAVQGISAVRNSLTVRAKVRKSGPGGNRESGKDTTTANRPVQTVGVEPEKPEQR